MTDLLTRAAASLSSFNPEARTVEAVLASESPVRRRDWETGGYVDEVLVCSPDAIDTSRMGSLALLDGHRNSSLEHRLGTVVPGSLRFERGAAIVTIQLSRNAKAEQVFQDLADGHTLAVSAGYRILTAETTTPKAGETATLRATRWEPLELSIVQIPADATATTRNLETPMTTANIKTRSAADETRIIELGRAAGYEALAAEALRGDESLADFRARLLDAMAAKSETIKIDNKHDGFGGAAREQMAARVDALVARMTGATPTAGAQFMTASLMDHARGIIESTGVDTRSFSRDEIIGRAMQTRSAGFHTTSDFPLLLQSAGQRVLQSAYEAAQSPLKTRIARMSMRNDFRKVQMLKTSDGGLLEKVNEAGEVKSTTRSEFTEGYSLATFARMFSISRQAIINDDLNAFADFNAMAGRMSALTENKLLFAELMKNSAAGPTMGEDGKAMFHVDHGNLGSPAALSVAALGAGRAAMRKQMSLDGKTRLNIAPAFLMVGPDKETEAEQLMADLSATVVGEQNPFGGGRLELAVESQLDGGAWYMFAAPGNVPAIEYSYLTGAPGVQVATKEEFDVLGMSYRAHLDFGCGPVDFRGAYRNAGA